MGWFISVQPAATSMGEDLPPAMPLNTQLWVVLSHASVEETWFTSKYVHQMAVAASYPALEIIYNGQQQDHQIFFCYSLWNGSFEAIAVICELLLSTEERFHKNPQRLIYQA